MCSGFPRATEAQGKDSNRPGRLGWSSDHLVPLGLLKSSGHLWMFTLNVSGSCLCLCVGSRGPACCVPCGQRREPWGSGPGVRSWAPCCPDWGPPAPNMPLASLSHTPRCQELREGPGAHLPCTLVLGPAIACW